MLGIGLGITRGGAFDPMSQLPKSGLIADWRFSEGSGVTVADVENGNDIDLTEAPTPNATWTSAGVNADSGAIETPSLVGIQTIVVLYRAEKAGAGFHFSGPDATNNGPYVNSVQPGSTVHIGRGFGVGQVYYRAGTGENAAAIATAGWRCLFYELPAQSNGFITFGSQGNVAANRFAEFDIGWALVYNRSLTDDEREKIYNAARFIARSRGFHLDFRDISTRADWVILGGQSNADGVALISELSPSDQARIYTNTFLTLEDVTYGGDTFSALTLGSGHNNQSATYFGLEVPLANRQQDTSGANDLYITKGAQGSTYLAPSSDVNVTLTWSTDEIGTNVGFYGGLYKQIVNNIGDAVEAGVGLNLRGFIWYQGEQDALHTSTANVWAAQFAQLVTKLDGLLGVSSYPVIIPEIYEASPSDATAYATVRAAQVSAAAALGSRGNFIDTGSYSYADSTHLDATGMQSLGADVAAVLW